MEPTTTTTVPVYLYSVPLGGVILFCIVFCKPGLCAAPTVRVFNQSNRHGAGVLGRYVPVHCIKYIG